MVNKMISENALKLKEYLERLTNGENLETVRADFVSDFKNASYNDVLIAEEELIRNGIMEDKMERLCEIHSALFHDDLNNYINVDEFEYIKNDPIEIMMIENNEIEERIDYYLDTGLFTGAKDLLNDVKVHYTKKGDLIYPLLKTKYGFEGPARVMWNKDNEIKERINKLKDYSTKEDDELIRILKEIKEMIYRENNILFPNCLKLISKEDLNQMYEDMTDYKPLFDIKYDEKKKTNLTFDNYKINFKLGSLSPKQVNALLNAIPYEISFINEDDINTYYNEGEKAFKRPSASIGRSVYDCHPHDKVNAVKKIISELKAGAKGEFSFQMKKNDVAYLVKYIAVKENEEYIGTLELVIPLADTRI